MLQIVASLIDDYECFIDDFNIFYDTGQWVIEEHILDTNAGKQLS
jgi:hypothetical protein